MILAMGSSSLWIYTVRRKIRYPYGQWGRSIYTLPNFGMKFTVYSN